MQVCSLFLHNFRNYGELLFEPSKGLNIIYGENAQGKTNLLESVFLCAFGRSHRTAHDAELVLHGERNAAVAMKLLGKGNDERRVEFELSDTERKRVTVDYERISKLGELMGCLNVVMFSPESLMLVKGSPAERRRYMDMGISQLGKKYFYRLQQYNAALKQRNALLKSPELTSDRSHVAVWDERIAVAGAYIFRARESFVTRILPIAAALCAELSGEREELLLTYSPATELKGDASACTEQLLKRLRDSLDDDIRRGSTLAGVHRDDIEMTINGRDARLYASQGQQRTIALALKLSEIEFIEGVCGEKPVVLLDDVFSELDESRCNSLLNATSGCQCLLTCAQETMLESIIEDACLYRCDNGAIEGVSQ